MSFGVSGGVRMWSFGCIGVGLESEVINVIVFDSVSCYCNFIVLFVCCFFMFIFFCFFFYFS